MDVRKMEQIAAELAEYVHEHCIDYMHIYGGADEDGAYATVVTTDRDGVTTTVSKRKGAADD